ncbi:hypothetical protein AAFP30_27745 [Gordonia sp. CPCC 205515]|uniref:hypothetical protein n=1 Tax=Gordonia sp. CPCC 205515 TaxID=3140791 RepID=UPI003AF36BD7
MITWTVTTYTPDTNTTSTDHGAADNRADATSEAAATARLQLDDITADGWTLPYLAIVIDDDIALMLAIGRDNDGRPDVAAAYLHLDALEAGAAEPGRIA